MQLELRCTRSGAAAFVFIALAWSTTAAIAVDLAGQASVIDGDTIEIHGQRIRLHGIDAPESGQLCEAGGEGYRCGQKAAFALADYIGERIVTCQQTDTDRYGRVVAVCAVGGADIGAWMVSEGWALAFLRYSSDYADEEAAARASGQGLWRGQFMEPWAWRKQNH